MVLEAKTVIEQSYTIIQDTIDSVIEGCQNREAPRDIKPYESITDLLIYKNREEEIKTDMGIFVIRVRTSDVVIYEKSTSIQVQTFRHRKTKKSELAAFKKCQAVIEEIKTDKKYTPPKSKTHSTTIKPNDATIVRQLPPPSFIPKIIRDKQTPSIPARGKPALAGAQ
jgi:hypothetical protein